MDHVIELDDWRWFKRCRRAWDLGSAARQNYVPAGPGPGADLPAALAEGLAAYYYPAMATWPRVLVRPIALDAFAKALRTQRFAHTGDAAGSDREWAGRQEQGRALLDRYFTWAEPLDRFTAVRARDQIQVVVPDPLQPEDGLRAADGRAIHLRGRLPLLVTDEHDRLWLVLHRFIRGPWADLDQLALDARAGALCWMAESHYVVKVAGVIFNEVRLADPVELEAPGPKRRGAIVADDPAGWCRRTQLRKTPGEIAQHRAELAAAAPEMTDPRVAIYPNPGPDTCPVCSFRPPCLAINAGRDPLPVLQGAYRPHVPEVIPLPPRTGSLGPQVVHGWKTKGRGRPSLEA